MTTDNQIAAPSFDRMRNMLVRAAEVRESEQQQIFDALDDIYARLAPVDSLGAVRKRLSELPDRTEVSVLAERLDETMSRLEAQDAAIAALGRTIESIVDKLAKPFAQLDGRLDGVGARFEGVAGRMDGLEDKLQNIHRRLDELGSHLDKQDSKLDALPQAVIAPVRERVDAAESGLRERIETSDGELRARVEDLDKNTRARIGENTEALKTALTETGEMIDASDRLAGLGDRLEHVTSNLDALATRLDKVEDGFTSQLGDLDGSFKSGLSKVEGTLSKQPDTESVTSLVRKSAEESERRIGGQLDEAMATFAELMLGGGPAAQSQMQLMAPAPPAPRQPRRTSRNGRSPKANEGKAKTNGEVVEETTEG